METSKLIISAFLAAIGILFFLNNRNMGKGTYKFYSKLYSKKNLIIMFRITGIFLFIMAIVLALTK